MDAITVIDNARMLLRSTAFNVLFYLSVVGYGATITLVAKMVSYEALTRIARHWSFLILWLLRSLCHLRYEVVGAENLPTGQAIVFSNHQSAWETIALRGLLPLNQVWVLKRELLWIPFFGWALAAYRPIAINRGDGRRAMRQLLREGEEALRGGRWLVVFPEGTRVAVGERRRFNIGGALLAERARVPVVPIAHNAGVFWERRAFLKRPGVIQVRIGPPIDPAGKTAAQINAAAQEWIEAALAQMPVRPS